MKDGVIFVTGGSGYIGSHLIRRLAKAGFHCVNFDISPPSAGILRNVLYHSGDIRSYGAIADALAEHKPVCVVHLAALTSNPTAIHKSKELHAVNVRGGENLLRAMVRCGCRFIVYTSSAAVYGEAGVNISESHTLRPISAYGTSKMIFEQKLMHYAGTTGIHALTLRLFNVAGNSPLIRSDSFMNSKKSLIINAFLVLLGKKSVLTVYGHRFHTRDGTAIRDYVHIDDAVDAIEGAIHVVKGENNLTVNIASGKGTTNLEVIDAIKRLTGTDIPLRFAARRAHEIIESTGDNRRARGLFQWEPRRSEISTIIQSVCDYYGIT